jgi:hypothetical protein
MKTPTINSYLRNSSGNTFQVTDINDLKVELTPVDFTGKKVTMGRSIFDQLCKNKNYDTVINPKNNTERMNSKQFASRFLN